ncbi:hypothetical protein GE061_002830 [Apolygus lucorum]|uniref:Uncharacterized protein n=1 Tax=Apolygus lucorum TaxID=248454 RepID=A0A8S9X7K5_APOLU|nr:hypothetical protein GE061_002830 [Apolygus lucorum]
MSYAQTRLILPTHEIPPEPMKWLAGGDSRVMLGESNGMVPAQQMVRQQQPAPSQMVGTSGVDPRTRAQDDAMVGYIYQRPAEQWSHHNLTQGGGDAVMYQDLRAASQMPDMQSRNGQVSQSRMYLYTKQTPKDETDSRKFTFVHEKGI